MTTDDTTDFKAIADELIELTKILESDMDDIHQRQEIVLQRLKEALTDAGKNGPPNNDNGNDGI